MGRDWDDEDTDEGDMDGDEDEGGTEECPYCGREVYEGVQQCPYCGKYISEEDAPRRWKMWIVIGVVLAGVAVVVMALTWRGG